MKKIFLIIVVLLLTGCYDYNELTDLAIVSTMIIDYKDDEYVVNLEILETKGNISKTSFFLEGRGDNFENAIIDTYSKTPKHIYFNHMFTVILSKSIAMNKLEDIYDFFIIDNDVRKDTIFVLSDDIDKFLNFETENKLSIGESIKSIFKYSKLQNGKYQTVNFREILNCYLNKKNYFLSSVKIENEDITLSDVYLINENKLSYKIESKYVLLANIIDNNVNSFLISIDENTYQIYRCKADVKVYDDRMDFKINVSARLFGKSRVPNSSKDDIKKIEESIKNYLKQYVIDSLKYSSQIHKDIYNLNYKYYLYFPNKDNKDIFESLKYRTSIDVTFNEKGLLLNKIGDDDNER